MGRAVTMALIPLWLEWRLACKATSTPMEPLTQCGAQSAQL